MIPEPSKAEGSFFMLAGELEFMLNNTYMIMCEMRVNSV